MRLSVIVCTRNRAHAIIPCLDSIAQSLAHAAPVDAEIVVVDNGSEDNTSVMVREWTASCAFPVNLQLEPKKGVSVARNRAVRLAQGDLLVFTDDDCRLDKNYIRDALRHDAADTEPVLRGGRVELGDPADLPLTIKTERSLRRWKRKPPLARDDSLGESIVGCNMTMRQALVDQLGFFDERFGPGTSLPAGDETDYIFRAYLADVTIEYVPDMVVFHHHGRRQVAGGHKLIKNYMIASGGVYAKYLFKDFCPGRPAFQDCWFIIKEIVSGNNYFMPQAEFFLRDLIACWLSGIVRYYALSFGLRKRS